MRWLHSVVMPYRDSTSRPEASVGRVAQHSSQYQQNEVASWVIYIWWPDIEDLVKSCAVCQQSRLAPAVAPLYSWEWPSEPWSRLHLNYSGPFLGHMFLVLVDAHLKWLDAHIMQSISSAKTIEKLSSVIATHGVP